MNNQNKMAKQEFKIPLTNYEIQWIEDAREREADNSFVIGFYDDGIEYAEKVINSRIWNS